MDKIKAFLKKPAAWAIGALVVGMIFGLVVLGWGVWPLQWVDASPADLQAEYQRDYLCMTIDSYIKNQDGKLMQIRWEGLGENASDLLDTLTPAACGFSSNTEIQAFKEMMGATSSEGAMGNAGLNVGEETAVTPMTTGLEPEKSFSVAPLVILVALTLVVGGVFVVLMKRRSAGGPAKPRKSAVKPSKMNAVKNNQAFTTANAAPAAAKREPALAQFMTTYRQGDDLYDDSFSIDSVNGEFLGECGVGIAETIGVGDPKKVTALEVWLFDKNDIQTVTKILMSEHANNDSAIRQRMVSKGEPILAEPGMTFVMETATLQLEAKIIDMVYARGPLPENSYFSRLTMEISVWPK
ncbi:MAG: hypothetical protein PWQ55_2585 [Chloroflexota bacterium]|nr:hypothetical protein [Chloroflexota bacterium]